MKKKLNLCFQCGREVEQDLWDDNGGFCGNQCESNYFEDGSSVYTECPICGKDVHYNEWFDNGGKCCLCDNEENQKEEE